MQTELIFDKHHTNLIKGIAILFMVLHHIVGLYYNHVDLSWYSKNSDSVLFLFILFFSTAGKVCVQLLTLLSGFGLAKSYSLFRDKHKKILSDFRFIGSHLLQFYSVYWPITVIKTLIGCHNVASFSENYGIGIKGIVNLILDFLGLSNLFGKNGSGDWFVSTIILLYIIFPVLFRLSQRNKIVSIVISLIPWFLFPWIRSIGISGDNILFCLLAFTTGIVFAQTGFLDKLRSFSEIKYKIIATIIVVSCFILRLIFSVYADYFFAISIIVFGTIVLSGIKYITGLLSLFGKHSANIWLSHIMIIVLLNRYLVFPVPLSHSLEVLVKYVIVLLTALLLSILIEYLKKITNYSKMIKRVRFLIENYRSSSC